MGSGLSERRAMQIRGILAAGWMLMIVSLFYDPITHWLTLPSNRASPFKVDPSACFDVQGVCLGETPYPFATQFFWGAIIPSVIFILLIFGHEFWRRICPLSFFSQAPRFLGFQRKKRNKSVKIKSDSWIGKNHLYLQFLLLYCGLCSRILFFNSDRTALGIFLISTIVIATLIGFLYGGKTWCNYFCPMGPVQRIYGEPRGLMTKPAHSDPRAITQSMCRTVESDGKEKSACVSCQTACIDIDAEKSYWERINRSDRRFVHYAYVGLAVGYFVYYYLYAGNWNYYMSGIWTHEPDQLGTLFSPGFYILGQTIPIPKIVAVPLTLGLFSILSVFLGRMAERKFKAFLYRRQIFLEQEVIQHRIFTIYTFCIFNFFFIFGGRYFIGLLPIQGQYVAEGAIATLSTMWFYRTFPRRRDDYIKEKLLTGSKKQLTRIDFNISEYGAGKHTLEELDHNEAFVLSRILPEFAKKIRRESKN